MKTLSAAAAVLAAAFSARADDAASDEFLQAIASTGRSTATAIDHSWLFNDASRLAPEGRAIGLLRVGYGGGSPTRAFAGNLSTSGATMEVGGELGLTDRLSAVAFGEQGQGELGASGTGALIGIRYSLLPRSVNKTQLLASAGVLRELQGNAGAWARLSFGHDQGPARIAASVHAERIFASGRDSLDVIITAGANVRLFQGVRGGVEYVGQDLEGAFGGEAEGGARHVVGPTLSTAFFGQRLSAVAGPAVALGAGQTHLLGRVALAYQF